MGFFDIFLSEEKRIQKQQRLLTNRDKQTEEREGAARWLAENKSLKACVALLTRFDMNLDNQLKDKDEKDFVYGLVSCVGENLDRPLDRHLRRCKQLATPLRLYFDLNGEEAAIDKVLELLDRELERDDLNKPQKKVDLLVWMADKRHPRAIEAIAPFLADFDENVRCSAAEVLINQQDDAAREPLERALANPDEESNRLRVRLAETFQQRGWAIEDTEAITVTLPQGMALSNGRVVRA